MSSASSTSPSSTRSTRILIDEARTPLIISGPTEESTDKYYKVDRDAEPRMAASTRRDQKRLPVDEKQQDRRPLTDDGIEQMEKLPAGIANLYDPANIEMLHHRRAGAARAHALQARRRLRGAGRRGDHRRRVHRPLMPGRRWSDGLHQAVEAKEGVKIENENQTLATITFQNYFRMYRSSPA